MQLPCRGESSLRVLVVATQHPEFESEIPVSEELSDARAWSELLNHLSQAAKLLNTLRKTNEPLLDFKQYSKLQVAETTIDKFAVDVGAVYQAVTGTTLD